MTDLLRMDYINALPTPLFAILCGGDEWPVYDIEVMTGLIRLDICGKVQLCQIGEVISFTDADGREHKPDEFYSDYDPKYDQANKSPEPLAGEEG